MNPAPRGNPLAAAGRYQRRAHGPQGKARRPRARPAQPPRAARLRAAAEKITVAEQAGGGVKQP